MDCVATKEKMEDQKEKEEDMGKPWVDYVPENKYVAPENLEERLRDDLLELNSKMSRKELFKLAYLDQKINLAYYQMWRTEANSMFRCIVKLSNRLKQVKNSKS